MSTLPNFDLLSERVAAGDRLSDRELAELSSTPDILRIGMLADTARQRCAGTRATYLRVASYDCREEPSEPIPASARELRITGSPATVKAALAAVQRAKAAGGNRTIGGFSWADVVRVAASDGMSVAQVLSALRGAGLDALVEVPLDVIGDPAPVIEALRDAGFDQVRLTIERAQASDRTTLLLRAGALQERYGCIRALNPLPSTLHPFKPTTGYEDVRSVAIARLAAPMIPTIQVDWMRYGPKLAQVALTFGADDLDAVSAAEDAPDGPRRAPMEELRRNIEAAGFTPAERDGHFNLVP